MKQVYKRLLVGAALLAPLGLTAQITYDYTGSMQVYTVPPGVTSIQIEAYGASGGDSPVGFGNGGLGGYVSAEFDVTPGEDLYIYVGGEGAEEETGGFNGGGNGVLNPGGGGASDVRQGGMTLTDRIIVAGGGGGGSYETAWGGGWGDGTGTGDGGDGGGLVGQDGESWQMPCQGGTGGSETSGGTGGGALGVGGAGATPPGDTGGGGGGYYGGGGGGDCTGYNGAGGGGSSYTDPAGLAVLHTQGVQDGNGQIIITELCNSLETTVSADTVCDGETVTLTASSTGSGVISWDGGVVDGEAFTPPVGTTTYTATSTDAEDCAFSIEILVHENPTVDAGDDVTVCEGEEVTLEADGTATDWSWDGGVEDGVAFVPTADGTYTLTGTIDSTGCMATDEVDVTITIVDVSMTVGAGNLTANQAEATYQWLECPDYTAISGETNQTFTPSADADYAVEVTYDGCVDTSACQVVHVGFGENELPLAKIYPNPTNGAFQIELEGKFEYVLTDVLGKTILSGQSTDKETFDLTNYADGAYFVKVIASGTEQTFKVAKR
ncbi:MAG: T9SS type A sorting domain-containing protein [Flavobacteriales bacterium]|jgi:hypothetical protein|nr:T9SS type A sorting domain-containing protein [Flavobacteriales bacterium]